MSDLEIGAQAPDVSSISTTTLARNTTSHDNYNAEDDAESMILDEPVCTGDAWQDKQLPVENVEQSLEDDAESKVLDEHVRKGDASQNEQLPAENEKQSLGNDQDPANDHTLHSTRANNVVFSKSLSKDDIENRLTIPMASLRLLPIPEGEHSTTLTAIDGIGHRWAFKVSTRKSGSHLKPLLSGQWKLFVEEKGLKVGDRISMYMHKDEAGEGQYSVRAERKIFNLLAGIQ